MLRMSQISWDALGRRRYDLVLPIWDPAVEWRWDAGFVALGWDELYRGHEGVKRSVEYWNQTWNEVSFAVREILDGGDTLVQRVTLSGRGIRSDLPTQMEVSVVARLDPLIVDFRNFLDDADALREAGFGAVAAGRAQGRA
jgi:hypothetical protein